MIHVEVEKAFAKLEQTAHRIADEHNQFKSQRDALLLALEALLKASRGVHIELTNSHAVRDMAKFLDASDKAKAAIQSVRGAQ